MPLDRPFDRPLDRPLERLRSRSHGTSSAILHLSHHTIALFRQPFGSRRDQAELRMRETGFIVIDVQ
jgi:hypothetical protein